MEFEFRRRDYGADHESHLLPRSRTQQHPLSSPIASRQHQTRTVRGSSDLDFFDPLMGLNANASAGEKVEEEDTSLSIEAVTHELTKEWKSLKRILIHSKIVSVEEGKALAEEEGLFFMETTALDATNVDKAFEIIIREILSNVSRKLLNSDAYKAQLLISKVTCQVLQSCSVH